MPFINAKTQGGKNMYEMKDEYLTGIEIIDQEHRRLFEIANETYELLHEEFIPDKYDHIVKLVNELKDYTAKHFADEEAYMESIQYKKMFTQKMQHAQFIEKLNELNLEQIDENQESTIYDLLDFLANWLIDHILETDKLIGQA